MLQHCHTNLLPCFSTGLSTSAGAMVARSATTLRRAAATRSMALFVSRQLKLMDWLDRHEFYLRVTSPTRPRGPEFAAELVRLLSPDELLGGMLTGGVAKAVIILKDKSGYRQLKLSDVGFHRRPRRQTILGDYGIVRGIGR
mgnify:CR=1 FL=1